MNEYGIDFYMHKRVVMLTHDTPTIDRRILIEAEALQHHGYEVILLSAWDGVNPNIFEIDNGVRIQWITYGKALPGEKQAASAPPDKTVLYSEKVHEKVMAAVAKYDKKKEQAKTRLHFYYYCVLLACNIFWGKLKLGFSKAVRHIKHMPSYIRAWARNILGSFFPAWAKNMPAAEAGNVPPVLPDGKELIGLDRAFFDQALFYGPDIVHVHDLPVLGIGVALKKTLGVPLVYDMHEYYPEQPRLTEAQRQLLKTQEQAYIQYVDYPITVNSLLGEIIKKDYGLSAIHIVQNALPEAGDYQHGAHYDRFREDHPFLRGRLLLLYQGWLAPERNLENIIEGMQYVTDPRYVLLVMGYGDYAEELKRLVAQLGLSEKVYILPAQPQKTLLTYTASADVGIVPYPVNRDINTMYSSPNKLYEFIAVNLPMLSNTLPYVEKVIDDYDFGVVADMSTPKEFAKAVESLTPERIAAVRQNMARRYREFMWETEQEKLLEIYRLIEQAGNGGRSLSTV